MPRTTIDLDERLFRRAQKLTGFKTKKAVVHCALENLVRDKARKGILKYYGSGIWQAKLKSSRAARIAGAKEK